MTFTKEVNDALEAKLDPAKVLKRDQGSTKVSYIEGWWAIAEANRIFGHGGWTRETTRLEETNRDLVTLTGKNGPYQQWRVGYLAMVTVRVGDVVRQGTGFGNGMGRPEALGDAIESAAKEAETDAMKRALMTFGWPFGLALYDKSQEHVEKPEPVAKAPKPEPAKPAADAFWSAFWKRANYELKGANITDLLAFAGAFETACKRAPTLDALLKLDQDNADSMAALKGQSPSAHKQARETFGAAQFHFTNTKAA